MTQVGTEGDVRRPVSRERLDSWKEIAGYLKRSVRTLRRWERQEGLPVHRHHHGKQGTIYSFTDEIDIWLKSRSEDRSAASSEVARRTVEYLKRSRKRPAIIAVLPFRSLSNDAGEQRFADGLTEEIIQEIGHRYPTQLRVIAFTSVIHYKQSPKQVGSIGRELGADYILEGGLRRYGRRVRLTARLIAAGDQTNIWAESYEIRLPPIFTFQQSLAHQLASSLSDVLHATQKKRRPVAEPTAAAHAAYIKGKSHFGLDEGATKKSIEQLNLAIQRDPNFAASYAELALAYFRRLHLSYPPIAILNQIHEGALKALHLDPTVSCGHTMMAAYNLFGAWNWQEADAGLRRAIRLNPSDVWAHTMRAAYHVIAGESRKTIEEL
jgi:TolB-like protein